MRYLTQRTHSYFVGGDQYKKEFISQLRFLIVVTFGFTIAFSWRQTTFDTTQSLVKIITHIESSSGLSFLTSLAITTIGILVILLTSKYLNPKRY